MRVLLTGATGFVGSHLLEKFIQMKIPVAIILRKDANIWRIRELLNDAVIIEGDLKNAADLEQQIIDFKADTLVHLAWHGVENRFRNEYQQISTNLCCVANLLEIAEKADIKHIIGFGSQGEYGPQNVPIDENIMPCPTTLYGAAKLAAYHLFNTFCSQKKIKFSWVRLFSIFGPKDNDSWLIPTIIKELLLQKEPALTEGRQMWDFLYVEDAVNAIIGILQTQNCEGVFNLGSGVSLPIRSVVEKIRDLTNPKIKLGFGLIPYRSDQVMFLEANINRLKDVTGWHPKICLDEGIQRTISWYQQQ